MPTVLVTGASRGLGLELVRQYGADGWDVLACARDPRKATDLQKLAAQSEGRVAVYPLDVTDFTAIDTLAGQLADRAIDVLISNAGTMGSRGNALGSIDFTEWDDIFRLNAFAPLKMAGAFAGHIARSSAKKLIAISTIMASLARNNLGGFYAYRASKAALNAIMVSLSLDLARRHGIIAATLHPGWVRTDMGGSRAEIDPATSVTGLRRVIASLTKERAGRFWAYDGSELPW